MGITVIGGLIFSTVLTLLLVPAYFSIAIVVEKRLGHAAPSRLIGAGAHERLPDRSKPATGGVTSAGKG